jgi:hypothetical protein
MGRPTFIQIKSLTSLSIKIRIGKREMVRAIRKSIDKKPKALQLCVFGEATKQEKGVPHREILA